MFGPKIGGKSAKRLYQAKSLKSLNSQNTDRLAHHSGQKFIPKPENTSARLTPPCARHDSAHEPRAAVKHPHRTALAAGGAPGGPSRAREGSRLVASPSAPRVPRSTRPKKSKQRCSDPFLSRSREAVVWKFQPIDTHFQL